MSIFQFIRIFWARWFIIAIATVSAAVGAFVVSQLVRPRYEATARLMMNLSKPDPVTGQMITGGSAEAYLDSQIEIIRGETVGGYVVDKLGWLSDPNLVSQYQGRAATDTRDFRRWLAQRVNDQTGVDFENSVMLITFQGASPQEVKVAAEELRAAYLAESLAARHAYARKYADRLNQQAEVARAAAEQAELTKAAYERETGLVSDGNVDVDTTKMIQMAGQAASVSSAQGQAAVVSNTASALSEIEAYITEASANLGPNHPRMIELKRRRDQLAAALKKEQVPDLTGAAATAMNQAYQAQRAKVLGQRDKVERLRQLEAQVELKRDEYRRTSARAAELNLEATISDNTTVPVGAVLAPTSPTFPNKKLMVGGATVLGLGLGFALALLLELLNRRVRGVEDLDLDAEIQCIGVIAPPSGMNASVPHRIARKLLGRSPLGMPV